MNDDEFAETLTEAMMWPIQREVLDTRPLCSVCKARMWVLAPFIHRCPLCGAFSQTSPQEEMLTVSQRPFATVVASPTAPVRQYITNVSAYAHAGRVSIYHHLDSPDVVVGFYDVEGNCVPLGPSVSWSVWDENSVVVSFDERVEKVVVMG